MRTGEVPGPEQTPPSTSADLFDVEEIFGFKVDGGSLHWALLVQRPAVADIGAHSEGDRLVLGGVGG